MAIKESDRIIAANVHVPIVGSTLVPLIVWLLYREQKDKADLVFQAKQAAVFQIIAGVVFFVLYFISILIGMVSAIGFLLLLIPLGLGALAVLYAIFAAWKNYRGEDFEYAVIGKMLRK
jgi:uncharacterized Tic20 family protein